ncbi:MAG: UDP-4-amino-4,6-dideoxy-N-acetyl-beta-L-altrosamine transaminase [Patescibacteria group bacterium]
MINYGAQSIDQSDIAAVTKVLKSPWLTQGPNVAAFEAALAKAGEAKYAVAVANGTVALHLAYLVAGLKKGDEVITTPNTFVATTNMLLAVGAKPVFCDLRLDTYNLDENKIEKLITPRTRAIVTVDFAGQACAYNKILALAKKYKLLVIADACHAIGATYEGKKVGRLADLTIFSFHPVKPITTAEGGAILTDNEDYYRKLMLLRSHGVTKDKKGFNVMTEFGYNYRLTDLQAALGLSQLKKLPRLAKKRHEVVRWYKKELGGVKKIILPSELKGNSSAWHLYVIRTIKPEDRLPLYNYLRQAEIGVNFHYPTVYSHPYYTKRGFATKSCPNADLYHDTAITLPLHTKLTKSEVRYIAQTIKNYFNA